LESSTGKTKMCFPNPLFSASARDTEYLGESIRIEEYIRILGHGSRRGG
jgi:hypothetical protein